MLNRLKLIIEKNNLKEENNKIKKENEQNRNDIEDLEMQKAHAKTLAEKTLDALEILQEIDRKGIEEKEKIKHRNTIINKLRIENIDIINELSNKFGSGR